MVLGGVVVPAAYLRGLFRFLQEGAIVQALGFGGVYIAISHFLIVLGLIDGRWVLDETKCLMKMNNNTNLGISGKGPEEGLLISGALLCPHQTTAKIFIWQVMNSSSHIDGTAVD